MAVDDRKANGSPVFLGTSAPATADDLTSLGDHIYERGTRLVGTTAQRNAYEYPVEGLLWRDTTAGVDYVWAGGAWVREGSRVLWQSASIMSDAHTASLSEPVSAQRSGIVLVWSLYSGGTVMNQAIHTEFIPRAYVDVAPGADYRFYMGTGVSSVGGLVANIRKLVRIYDDRVEGSASNGGANNSFVLIMIVGV